MIKQIINIDNYWEVIVYYDIDYNFFNDIVKELDYLNTPVEEIDKIYYNMKYKSKAFTYSNLKYRVSIVGFNKHFDKYDYINSIIHEAEHIKQHMLRSYKVLDEGEPPAYTVGYVATKMLQLKLGKFKLLR